MPENYSAPEVFAQNEAGADEVKLTDWLPDLLDDRQAEPGPNPPTRPPLTSPSPTPFAEQPEQAVFTTRPAPNVAPDGAGLRIIGLAVALLIGSLLLIGLAFWLVNLGGSKSATEVLNEARTPVATVAGITPVEVKCPQQPAFGPLETYTCARPMTSNPPEQALLAEAEPQLSQDGYPALKGASRWDVSSDPPGKILQFYEEKFKKKDFTLSRALATGTTPVGGYRVFYYTGKDKQQFQILVLNLNRASSNGSLKPGETLIRLSSG